MVRSGELMAILSGLRCLSKFVLLYGIITSPFLSVYYLVIILFIHLFYLFIFTNIVKNKYLQGKTLNIYVF